MKDGGISSNRSGSGGLSQEQAEALAIEVLGFLAADIDRLGAFLAQSGLSPENLRAAAGSPGFLVAVVSHLMQDDALLLAFAEHSGRDPRQVALARDRLDPPPSDI